MLVLLGYFVIAVGAGVAASGIIGYIVASILIRRYEKADPPLKNPLNKRNYNPAISYPPTALPAPTHVPQLPSSS